MSISGKVGIIIVTYNSSRELLSNLEAVTKQTYKNYKVYIVDNCSNDQTLNLINNYLKNSSISIKLITNSTNAGYAGGNNIGIKKSISEGCEYSFILNPDMILDKHCLELLVNRIKNNSSIACVGPIVLYNQNNNENTIQVYGVLADFKSQKKTQLYMNRTLDSDIPEELFVDYVNGGAMLIRNDILMKAGFFEEKYFMYNDELDLAHRLKIKDYKYLVIKKAVVHHHHDWSIKNKKGYYILYYYGIRNRYLYFKKYGLFWYLLLSLFKEIGYFPVKILWALRVADSKLIKYYYLGLWKGLIGETGQSKLEF